MMGYPSATRVVAGSAIWRVLLGIAFGAGATALAAMAIVSSRVVREAAEENRGVFVQLLFRFSAHRR